MTTKFGIIGFGAFGQFIAKHLNDHGSICYYDLNNFSHTEFQSASLETTCLANYIFLSVPAQQLSKTLSKIAPLLTSDNTIIDVCSIKQLPVQLLEEKLPKTISYFATHPLFGPKSGAVGIKGLNIVICESRIAEHKKQKIVTFLQDTLGLKVYFKSALEHDQEMAYVQGLTHFVAKALNKIQAPSNLTLTTVTYEHLMKLKDIVSLDSDELFEVIQCLNPNSQLVRKELLNKLSEIDNSCSNKFKS